MQALPASARNQAAGRVKSPPHMAKAKSKRKSARAQGGRSRRDHTPPETAASPFKAQGDLSARLEQLEDQGGDFHSASFLNELQLSDEDVSKVAPT